MEILNNSPYVHAVQGTKVGLSFQHTAAYICIKANKACIGREYKKKPEQLH